MKAVRKSISIPKEQDEWIKENNISLSKLVQEKIEKEMENKK